MFIDTHCHLDFPEFDADRPMVIGNAKKAGVKKFVNPGADFYSSKRAVELATKNPGVLFAGVGLHPYEAQHNWDVGDLEKMIIESNHVIPGLTRNPSSRKPDPGSEAGMTQTVVAIGECGLDYHQYGDENALGKKDNQKRLFEAQLELAGKYNLPVIMHVRDAFDDFFRVIDSQTSLPRGVIHCFSGGNQDIRMADERKFLVGIDGNVTYSKQLWLTVPQIPLRMFLLETDSPLLPPAPHRGTRNEPKYIPLIAEKIAELQKIIVAQVEEQTTKNALDFFRIS